MSYLRNAVGTDEKFDEWLTHYTTKFAFHCVTPEGMLECFFEYFPELKGTLPAYLSQQPITIHWIFVRFRVQRGS